MISAAKKKKKSKKKANGKAEGSSKASEANGVKDEQGEDEDEEDDGTELPAVHRSLQKVDEFSALIHGVEGIATQPHPPRRYSAYAVLAARACKP